MSGPGQHDVPEVAFSLGSNLGDRLQALRVARQMLLEEPRTSLAACSPLYETEPVGVDEAYQHLFFLNAVVIISGGQGAEHWLAVIQRIEQALDRQRGPDRYAPRTIDVDLLYCGEQRLTSPSLTVPHPRWLEREFVVRPLADVRPGLVLPGCKETAAALITRIQRPGAVRLFARDW